MPSVFIPARVRGIVYTVYAILGLALGATQVGFSAAELGQPVWLKVALSVFAFVGAGIGYTAASNTPAAPSELVAAAYAGEHRTDAGRAAVIGMVALMLLTVFVLVSVYFITRGFSDPLGILGKASDPQAILGKAILGKA